MSRKTSRRHWLVRAWTFVAAGLWFNSAASSQEVPSGSTNPAPGVTIADLEQQLKSGLRARRPVEFEFIHAVVVMVQEGDLPIDLVQSTFLWARRHKPYPYPYFERGLRDRAAKAGYAAP